MLLSLAFVLAVSSTAAPEGFTTVAPDVFLLRGAFVPGQQPDGNTVVFRGRGGLVVVDTGRHPEHTNRVVAYARAARLPVVAVVNTRWHLDHVGGNVILRREFPALRVWAGHGIEEAMTGFLANYRKQLQEQIAAAGTDAGRAAPFKAEVALIDAGRALFPDDVVTRDRTETLAGRRLQLRLETYAVTASDVQVYDPKARVVVAGDLVTLPAPFLDTACPQRWKEALGRLAAVDFTMLVPGHGPVMSRQDFATYRAAFDGLLACAASSASKEQCIDGWLKQAGALVPAADHELARGLVGYYLDAHLRGDPAKQARLCGASGR
jgi:glyoxylase-like metal-dependent hydrolase (beta-lactamase superfamily II)